jgi:RNA polymerase sigma factor (sigma-70 family)
MTCSSAASTPPVVSFADLCALARARLPERLYRLKVPAQDVGDVVHDVLLIARSKLGQFQPRPLGSEAEVDTDRALLAWLVGIAWRRVTRDRTRARSRLEVRMGNVGDLEAAGAAPLTPEDLADRARQTNLALALLAGLRRERAEVLVLHDVGGLPLPEIAALQKTKANTAKSRLRRAREDVRAILGEMSRATTPFRPLAGAP